MSEPQTPVAEIVTFRLMPGVDPADFVKAARALDPMLAETPAMLGRTLSLGDDGLWRDHIRWASLSAAQQMAAAVMQDPRAAPMMQMIDPDHVEMQHTIIHHQQE